MFKAADLQYNHQKHYLMKTEKAVLTDYLNAIFPSWETEVPTFMDYIEEIKMETDEPLPSQRGDIYFVSIGAIGKYQKKIPKRYITTGELIIIKFDSRPLLFRALEDSCVMLLQRHDLYRLADLYPVTIQLYDQLLAKQEQSADFRETLLEIPKAERLEVFRSKFGRIIPLISRTELALFLGVSREYLRRLF